MLSACKYYLPCHIPSCLESSAKKYGWGRNARSRTGPAFPPCYFQHTWNIYSSATIPKGLTKFIQGSKRDPDPINPHSVSSGLLHYIVAYFWKKGPISGHLDMCQILESNRLKFVPVSIGRSHYLTLMFISFEYYVWMQFIHSLLAKIKGE